MKKNYHHKQAMKVTWSDDSNSTLGNEEEHVAKICFMAIESDIEVQSSDDKSNLFYNELHDAFETFYDEYKNLGSNYNSLKKSYACY